jgi:3-isopropylmalate/(R)-2-methylmalate dehydratase small subunit
MEQFIRITGIAAPLLRDNVDTDLLVPSREMTQPGRAGYGEKLLATWRYLPGSDGGMRRENPDFVLNRGPFRSAVVLIAGANFGSGSSREQAAWALRQFGFRAILAPSFGLIFQNNCYRNGLLPIVLPRADIEALATEAEDGRLELTVDLEREAVSASGDRHWPITIPASEREMMLRGLDAIGLTLQLQPRINTFQQADRVARPWVWLAKPSQDSRP